MKKKIIGKVEERKSNYTRPECAGQNEYTYTNDARVDIVNCLANEVISATNCVADIAKNRHYYLFLSV